MPNLHSRWPEAVRRGFALSRLDRHASRLSRKVVKAPSCPWKRNFLVEASHLGHVGCCCLHEGVLAPLHQCTGNRSWQNVPGSLPTDPQGLPEVALLQNC